MRTLKLNIALALATLSAVLLPGCATRPVVASNGHRHSFRGELLTFKNVNNGYSVWEMNTCTRCGTIETKKLQ
jgi:hypothetical protein